MIQLYTNIRKRRLELGMTQEELAKLVGYSDRTSIAKIESGKVDLQQSKIIAFAKALRTTQSALMGWDEEKLSTKEENDEFEIETIAAHKENIDWTEEEKETIEMVKEMLLQKRKKKAE